MGIHNLHKFLRSKCPEIYKEEPLSNYQFKKCAVDISLYIFKYITIFGEDAWLSAIINLISCLRRNEIHACFIYDTSSPVEKLGERQERREKRDKLDTKIMELTTALEKAKLTGEIDDILVSTVENTKQKRLLGGANVKKVNLEDIEYEIERIKKQSVHLTSNDFQMTKDIFDILGVPYFQAPMEAETTCADLCKRGIVDFVLSEDTDVLAYGAPLFLTKINTSTDTCVVVKHQDILDELEFTSEQFLDFCIMCGTDYNKNIFKIGPEKAYKLIKEHGSIDNIKLDTSCLNHIRVRELFCGYEKFEKPIPYCKQPDLIRMETFLFQNNIRFSINKLKKDFSGKDLMFED